MADMDYIGNRASPSYLSVITNAYSNSKKIMEHHITDNLNTKVVCWH